MEAVSTNETNEIIQPRVRKNKKRIQSQNLAGTLMILLPMIGFLVFSLFPIVLCLVVSFTDLIGVRLVDLNFVGFQNYIRMFTMSDFVPAIRNTLLYSFVVVPCNTILSVYLAYLVSKKFPGSGPARIILFIPRICSGVAVVFVFQWIFQEDFGVFNTIFHSNIKWFTDANAYRVAVFIMSLWLNGTNIIILDSAFANVDKSLQEAARMDGASEMKVFWSVTFKCVTPAIFYAWTMGLIAGLQEQAIMQFFTPTNPYGPSAAGITLTLLLYLCGFGDKFATYGMGVSCALSWFTAIVIIIITRLNFWTSKFWVHYEC